MRHTVAVPRANLENLLEYGTTSYGALVWSKNLPAAEKLRRHCDNRHKGKVDPGCAACAELSKGAKTCA